MAWLGMSGFVEGAGWWLVMIDQVYIGKRGGLLRIVVAFGEMAYLISSGQAHY